MSRRNPLLVLLALAGAGCSDSNIPVGPPLAAAVPRTGGSSVARERLARALAVALADSNTRASVKRRLDTSKIREGKLQFQALVRADQGALLASIARASATNAADLIADLDGARGLELYLPVAAQRATWNGNARYLVGTIGNDGEIPVAFDGAGNRYQLDAKVPPPTPVLALVPQETDFSRAGAARVMTCGDACGDPSSGGSATGTGASGAAPGLYLVQSHFDGSYESWLKGDPEYEYHIYGIGDNGQASVELACIGEHAGGAYTWDQNALDWGGSTMLFSDVDYNAYQAKHPGSPIRIVAWEDDDEACVDHADVNNVTALVTAVDNAYKSVTSGKVDPWYLRGIKAAPSIFSMITAIHNIILTNDDFIGNAVEGTVTGDAPNGSNWVLKTSGTVTAGWFTTLRVK